MNLPSMRILGFLALPVAAFGLYWAKVEAQTARDLAIELERAVEVERRAVRALEADLTWLERPDVLERAAREGAGLVPLSAERIATLGDLDRVAPLPAAAPAAPERVALGAPAAPPGPAR